MERALNFIAVDVGNTSCAIGYWSQGCVSKVVHVDGGFNASSDSFRSLYGKLKGAKKHIDAIAYASVVPDVDAQWERLAKDFSLRFVKVDYTAVDEVRRYPHPETIGADRLADAVGAIEKYGAPLIIMDFGTALTAAVVTADKIWQGGVIAPGFPLMRDYLFERTAKLPRMELDFSKVPKIGRSTLSAMQFGALVGYRGMVREIVSELSRNFKCDFKLVATGGFAKKVLGKLDMPFVIDQKLTLYGIGLICSRKL